MQMVSAQERWLMIFHLAPLQRNSWAHRGIMRERLPSFKFRGLPKGGNVTSNSSLDAILTLFKFVFTTSTVIRPNYYQRKQIDMWI